MRLLIFRPRARLQFSESPVQQFQPAKRQERSTTAWAPTTVKSKSIHKAIHKEINDVSHLNFIAGNLRNCYKTWSAITNDPYILEAIRGYKLELSQFPSQPSNTTNTGDIKTLRLETCKLVQAGVVKEVSHMNGEVISPVFLVPKKDGSGRMILNLKCLNQSIEYEHFKMSSINDARFLIQRNCFLASVDLEKAYYSVPIHHEFKKYLRFVIDGCVFEYQVLPNGLASAPKLFTRIMKVLFSHLRSQGFTSVAYIDDSLLIESSYEKCLESVNATVELFLRAGFFINWEKSVLKPVKLIEFLGFKFDSDAFVMTLPDEKLEKLQLCVSDVLSAQQVKIRKLAGVIGFIISVLPAFRHGKLYYRNLEHCKIKALARNRGNFDKYCAISEDAEADLVYWHSCARKEVGVPICVDDSFDIEVQADASLSGFGFIIGSEVYGDSWSANHLLTYEQNINTLEMLAIWQGLKAFESVVSGKRVLVRCDNSTALCYLNNMGGQKSNLCNDLAKTIWQWCIPRKISLLVSHIPGNLNAEADFMSRLDQNKELSLTDIAFKMIVQNLGCPCIDIFASGLNAKVPTYISWKPENGSVSVDCFTSDWAKLGYIYAFPPFSVLLRTLRKVRKEAKGHVIIVYPEWPAQVWFPILMDMMLKGPFSLPAKPLIQDHPMGKKLRLRYGLI